MTNVKKSPASVITALHIIKCFRLQRLKCGKSNNVLLNNNCFREWYCTLQREDGLVLLKEAENNYLECQKGKGTGRVHLPQMKIITPLDEHLRSRPNVKELILYSPHITHGSTFQRTINYISSSGFSIFLTRVKITVAFYSI